MQLRSKIKHVIFHAPLVALLSIGTVSAEQFIPRLINSSTIPANGDVNPYGVAFVPPGFPSGAIAPGAKAYTHVPNAAALVLGPTGLQ